MKFSFFSVVFLLLGASTALGQETAVTVPVGTAPIIDGTINETEWADAVRLPLHGGEALYLKRAGQQLYIAIRGAAGGIGSVCLGNRDSFRVLHASTGLITAAYERAEEGWRLVHGFRGPRRETGERFARGEAGTEPYLLAQLEQFGWVANLVEVGPGTDMEYRVDLASMTDSVIYLSVVFLQVRAPTRLAHAPTGLADASLDTELVAGGANDGLAFVPTSWLELRFSR
jgi:hypothetical protein